MKRTVGLLVATGLMVSASYSFGKPPSKAPAPATKVSRTNSKSATAPVEAEVEAAATPAVPSATDRVWTAADRDRDGSISFGEFASVVNDSITRRVQKRFQQLDRNHDGRCTQAEVNKMASERFARFDLNHDGVFTARELASVMRAELAHRMQALYVRLDVDKNGSFSVAELTPAPQPATQARKSTEVASRTPAPTQ